jgi:nucleotide sugar dehydrogenase
VKVLVVGQGYVGLPLALACVAAGHEVTGVDTDVRRIAALSRGESYLGDVTAADVRTALATGRYHPATEVGAARGFDIAVIAVPTGLSADGLPDLSHVEAAGHAVGAALAVGSTVVLESTTYPGTTTGLLVPILEAESGLRAGSDFLVGYSPERVDPGNPEWPYARIPKVVSGIDEASLDAVEAFYASVVEATVPVASTAIAELSKLLENTFRHVNIALVNELAQFAAGLGVDLGAAIDAASTKPFGFMPFRPGPGVGGHCLPVDPTYLSWRVQEQTGERFHFVELANRINEQMPGYVVGRALQLLAGEAGAGRRVLVVGLAYKPETGDMRGSPGLEIVRLLGAAGCDVVATDPLVAMEEVPVDVEVVALTPSEVAAADLVVVVVPHRAVDLAMVVDRARLVLDTRRCVSGPRVVPL